MVRPSYSTSTRLASRSVMLLAARTTSAKHPMALARCTCGHELAGGGPGRLRALVGSRSYTHLRPFQSYSRVTADASAAPTSTTAPPHSRGSGSVPPPVQSIPPNIPREDYATPTMHTFRIIGRLFRYSVYASVAIVVGGTSIYAALHAYVEYIALHGRDSLVASERGGPDFSDYFDLDELLPAYSGAHRGGGTDSDIGWKARSAARAAYIALEMQSGGIPAGTNRQHSSLAIPDGAWLDAERYLRYALACIDKHPQSLQLSSARAELLERLAEVQSKMAGSRGLTEARRNYQELLRIPESTDNGSVHLNDKASAKRIRLAGKLALTEARIASELLARRSPSAEVAGDVLVAVQRFEDTLRDTLKSYAAGTLVTGVGGTSQEHGSDEHRQEGRRSSWFSRSSPPAIGAPNNDAQELSASESEAWQRLPPIVQRTLMGAYIISCGLLATSGHLQLAERRTRMARTHALSDSAQAGSTLEERLHEGWMKNQSSVLDTYLAEIDYTLKASSETKALELLQMAIDRSDAVLRAVPKLSKASALKPSHPWRQTADEVGDSASRAGASAARILGTVLESSGDDYGTALRAYEASLSFSERGAAFRGSTSAGEQSLVLQAIRRCREKSLPSA